VVYGLVCSTSSVFSSGCFSRWGFLASGFHCVYVCVYAWLGAFGVYTGVVHVVHVVISLLLNTTIKHTTIVVFHD